MAENEIDEYLDIIDDEAKQEGKKQDKVPKSDTYTSNMSKTFKDMFLKEEIMKALTDCGFEHPSEVQQECLPHALNGVDIIAQAKSGMGKTTVYILGILNQIGESPKGLMAIVLTHTRELATQIYKEFMRFSKYFPNINSTVAIGGISIKNQIENIKSKDFNILIGTPGRLLELENMKIIDLKDIKYFVIDECDKILSALDMRRDLQKLFLKTPISKQVYLFSATLPKDILEVAKKFTKNAFELLIDYGKLTLHGIKQFYVKLNEKQKIQKLFDILDDLKFNQVMIFVKSVIHAKILTRILKKNEFPSLCVHGDLNQIERLQRYKDFKEGKFRIMVSTDIFGRGIDFEKVNISINFDMPESVDAYLHRAGRCGRFGTNGIAITFVVENSDEKLLEEIQSRLEVKMENVQGKFDPSICNF